MSKPPIRLVSDGFGEVTPANDDPHTEGEAICTHCRHKWHAVAPVGGDSLRVPVLRDDEGDDAPSSRTRSTAYGVGLQMWERPVHAVVCRRPDVYQLRFASKHLGRGLIHEQA